MRLECKVNNRAVAVDTPPMARLIDLLREELRLTGTKEGCGEGECGACTVLIDTKPACSCLVPVVQVQNADITTVEGLAQGEQLAAIQKAFLDYGGAQCGICTPGFLVMAQALLNDHPQPSREQVREALAGNLCRCTGYQKIVDAVENALVGGANARE